MRSLLVRVSVAMATVVLLALAPVPAHADPEPGGVDPGSGAIAGRFTDSAGNPVGGGVGVYDADLTFIRLVLVDLDGGYRVDNLAPGDYRLNFFTGRHSQWAHRKLRAHEADAVPVAADATTVVDETLIPTGSLGGTLTGGFAGIRVVARLVADGLTSGSTETDGGGRFELAGLVAGRHTVTFELAAGVEQHYPGQLVASQAQPVTVVGDQHTEVNDTLLPHGSGAGRLTEDGLPVPHAQVYWTRAGSEASSFAFTDADGRFHVPHLFAGGYRVQFILPDQRTQWAPGKLTQAEAGSFTVAGGATTVVDEAALPTGQVRVRAVDAKSGAPVTDFCASVGSLHGCADNGVASFAKVSVGRHEVSLSPQVDTYLSVDSVRIQVSAGGVTELTVRLTPAAIITTVVRDRRTGGPVADVCLHALALRRAVFPDDDGACSDAWGRVRIGSLAAGTYTLFARPRGGSYGAQWVGRHGGTGNPYTAWLAIVTSGQTVVAPDVRLDGAGSVTGRVTDKTTGAGVPQATVSVLTFSPGAGHTGPHVEADGSGSYTLDGLGPYDWPLFTSAFPYASQWSGGAASRPFATPVTVRAGQTTTAHTALTTGSTLRGTVPVAGAFTVAYDALTGDIVGISGLPQARYELRLLGPSAIRIQVIGESIVDGWHRNAADFAHATTILVPSHGPRTVDLQVR